MNYKMWISANCCALALISLAPIAGAQAPPPAPPLAIPSPTYVSIPMEITVNRPAVEVWKRVGKYCRHRRMAADSLHDHLRQRR